MAPQEAVAAAAAGAEGAEAAATPPRPWAVWPASDFGRLVQFLEASSLAKLAAGSTSLRRELQAPLAALSECKGDAARAALALEAHHALGALNAVLAEAGATAPGALPAASEAEAMERLEALEQGLQVECRYLYGPDWDPKPGKLVSRKGTWIKDSTKFSWELSDTQKLYLPSGIAIPVLQIGKVTDASELKRHEWVGQHLRAWLKPSIVKALEARRGAWFVYYPHFEDRGRVLIAQVDTWMKRTTQLSGELDPFEMIYIPKGLPLRIASDPEPVEEEWEKYRHQHVHLHRKVMLETPPLTVKQEKYDVFIGQGNDRWVSHLAPQLAQAAPQQRL